MVWKRVRSLWENEKAFESTTESLMVGYRRNRQKYPERDLTFWLAWSVADRPKWGHVEKEQLLMMAAPSSITEPAHATRLLTLSVVSEEYPELNRLIGERQQELYLPVDFAIRNGTFLTQWKTKNPWTDTNYPSIAQSLREDLLAGETAASGEKVHLTCPQCFSELKIPGVTHGKKIRCPKCRSIFSVDG